MEERKGFLSVAIFQAAFIRRLWLILKMSLIPRPLLFFGLHISSQDLK
jgi:hypothetical protein